jgi:nitrate/TMAO reductase-like tetraheme cytochrome c subunit
MLARVTQWLFSLNRLVRWIVILTTLTIIVLVAITVSATTWEYTNSSEFCGTMCHTMPPEYAAYQVSPHARVACVDCHLGQDSVIMTVPRKAREVRHVINALTQAYEPPIYSKSLRPARDTCERCHNPEKFSSDTFVEIKRYDDDVLNSETRNFLIVKTGGGSRREGLGRGIHWHIENEVYFYANDALKQDIPYIREVGPEGEVKEYFDVEAELPPDFGAQVAAQLHRMDCIDCHTRISHLFRSPSDAMDEAIARRQIDVAIPEIKKQGVEILSQTYDNTAAGLAAIETLATWYRENYPDYYAGNQGAIQEAVQAIQDIFTITVFPNLNTGWETHPSNDGHREFPGCFRCHDGKHTSAKGETIRLECNLCHSIPEIVGNGGEAPVLTIDRPDEPDSHLDSNWLARHRFEFDTTCADCHDISNPGGTDDSSFCANSGCHATQWKFVGLDAPAIRAMVAPPALPGNGEANPVPHPVGLRTDCNVCHGPSAVLPAPADHEIFEEETLCTQCHEQTEGDVPVIPVPEISHLIDDGLDQCLACHTADGFKPYPDDHERLPASTCLLCHKSAATPEPIDGGSIPHLVAGFEKQCLACHGLDDLVPFTPAHRNLASETCQNCHLLGPAEAEPAGEDAPKRPRIPHTIEGWEDCLLCHSLDGISPLPDDDRHQKAELDDCQICHKPTE